MNLPIHSNIIILKDVSLFRNTRWRCNIFFSMSSSFNDFQENLKYVECFFSSLFIFVVFKALEHLIVTKFEAIVPDPMNDFKFATLLQKC